MSPRPPRVAGAVACRGIAFVLAAGLLGCGGGDSARVASLRELASLPGARGSDSPALVAAVQRLERQGGLPTQVGRPPIEAANNAATMLRETLNAPLRVALNKPLRTLLDREQPAFAPEEIAVFEQLLNRHEGLIQRLREACQRPDARFPLGLEIGFFAATDYLDDAAIACRFEFAAAAAALHAGEVSAAVDDLLRGARWIGWLAAETRIEPRLLAARLRSEWLLAVEAVAAHPEASLADYERLRETLIGWLAAWPGDAASLAGDRAATLHAYEAIRRGRLDEVATRDERLRLAERGVTGSRTLRPPEIDADELAYLQVADRMIAAAGEPYHRRSDHLATPYQLLGAEADAAPLATELFLPGLTSAIDALATDRAGCELWAIGLSAAGGFKLPDCRVNWRSGEPYRVERLPRSLLVRSGDASMRDAFALLRGS